MKWAFVICVALLGTACKDHELARLAGFRDEVCACKTAECANAVLAKLPTDNIKSTPKSQGIAREMLDCLAELDATGRPSLDPDAPLDPEPAP